MLQQPGNVDILSINWLAGPFICLVLRCETAERPGVWVGEPSGGGRGAGAGRHHWAPAGDRPEQGLHPAGRDVLRLLPGRAGEGDVGGGGEGGGGRATAGHQLAAGAPPVRRSGRPSLRLSARQLRLPGRRTPSSLGSGDRLSHTNILSSSSSSLQTSGRSEGSPRPPVQCRPGPGGQSETRASEAGGQTEQVSRAGYLLQVTGQRSTLSLSQRNSILNNYVHI